MSMSYNENPQNINKIDVFTKTKVKEICKIFYAAKKILFYDACSFRKHSCLPVVEKNILIKYYKSEEMVIFVTRCVLMELASKKNRLSEEQIEFIRLLSNAGITVAIFDEEYTYDILCDCFSVNKKINEYLMWAVRIVNCPVSTMQKTLEESETLNNSLMKGQGLDRGNVYSEFFRKVRQNKEEDDNLGEELLAACLYNLSHLPGIPDGKLCVITEDKGAASKIDSIRRKTPKAKLGAEIMIFSTPKLIQYMFRKGLKMTEEQMINLLSVGNSGNIAVMAFGEFDLKVDKKSMPALDLVHSIMDLNKINIAF